MRSKLYYIIKTMRPKQWTKNLFVLAGIVFAGEIFAWQKLFLSLATLFFFCLLSGAVYIFNDISDLEQDKLHPRKSRRPLAAGLLNLKTATFAGYLCVIISLVGMFLLSPAVGVAGAGYLLVNILYVHILKKQVILDILAIAAGFVLRVLAGAAAVEVPVSPWLLLCTILLSFFLGLGKRRYELVTLAEKAGEHRSSLSDYSLPLLDQMISAVTSATLLAYSLYTFLSAEANHHMMASIPFVLYGLFRYLYLLYKNGEGGSPEELLLQDKPLLINLLLWGIVVLAAVYFV